MQHDEIAHYLRDERGRLLSIETRIKHYIAYLNERGDAAASANRHLRALLDEYDESMSCYRRYEVALARATENEEIKEAIRESDATDAQKFHLLSLLSVHFSFPIEEKRSDPLREAAITVAEAASVWINTPANADIMTTFISLKAMVNQYEEVRSGRNRQ